MATDQGLWKLVEKQMRNWEIARSQKSDAVEVRTQPVEDFITISRTVGSGGSEVANLLGDRLGWPVFDRQVLELMASDDQIRKRLYQHMDERDLGWFEEIMFALTGEKYARNDYFHRLCQTILSLARQGNAIFLGRAADLILPPDAGLRIRIVAPSDVRVRRYADRHNMEPSKVREQLERIEAQRSEFIERHFRVPANEQTRHDLIVNLQRWTALEAADLIMTALRLKSAHAMRTHPLGSR